MTEYQIDLLNFINGQIEILSTLRDGRIKDSDQDHKEEKYIAECVDNTAATCFDIGVTSLKSVKQILLRYLDSEERRKKEE